MDKLRICPSPTTENVVLNSEGREVYLFEVRTSWKKAGVAKSARTFVLAVDAERAEDQHQCVLDISSFLEGHEATEVHSSAVRVPFSIQGWSNRVF